MANIAQTPINPTQGFDAPLYGAKSRGFAVQKRCALAAPPFSNNKYIQALQDVRGKGIQPELMGTLPSSIAARTTDETLAGIFWGYDGSPELGTPPRLYNQIIREIAINKPNPDTGNPKYADAERSAIRVRERGAGGRRHFGLGSEIHP